MPTPERRLVILTEGQVAAHNAKTAFGVIRFGTEPVVAVLDSTIAGRQTWTATCSSADDPFEGLELGDDCRWRLPEEPGLGVRRRFAEPVEGRAPAFG